MVMIERNIISSARQHVMELASGTGVADEPTTEL